MLCDIKYIMKATKRAIAATELLLIFPSALFMTALFMRNVQPVRYEPAHTAQRIVDWFAVRPHLGLWGFLMAFPLAVFAIGCGTLLRSWNTDSGLREAAGQTLTTVRAHLATLLVALATLTAGGILAIVALHVMTD